MTVPEEGASSDPTESKPTEAGDAKPGANEAGGEGEKPQATDGGAEDFAGVSISSKAAELLEFDPKPSKFDSALLQPLSLLDADAEHIEQFADEFKKLQQALRKSYESENRFINKCKSLTKQIRSSSHKLTALSSLHQTDLKKKDRLKKDIDENRVRKQGLIEEVSEKREQAKSLQDDIKALQAQLENSTNDLIQKQKQTIEDLELEVNKFTAIRDKERGALTKIRTRNIDLFKKLQDELAKQKKGQEELDNLERKIRETNALSSKELRRKQELERGMQNLKAKVSERQTQINARREAMDQSRKELQGVTDRLNVREETQEKHMKEIDRLIDGATDMNQKVTDVQEQNDISEKVLKKAQKQLDEELENVRQAQMGSENKRKMLMMIRNKVKVLTKETREVDRVKQEWQNKMKEVKENISKMQVKINNNSKQMDTCVREREVLSQNHISKVDAIKMKELALKIKKSALKNIKNEHQGYLVSIRGLTRVIENLKADKAVHEADLNKKQVQKARALEEVTERELKISQFQQQILVNESKLRQQQNYLEAVRSDRNLYRKSLIEQKNEMQEFKRKYSNLNMQIKQLKQEIAEKDMGFVTEHFTLEQVKSEIKILSSQNDSLTAEINKKDEIIKNQSRQIRKLTTIIADADEELRVQTKQYNAIVNEQRVLNQQLIKRNEELAQLYEQLKLQNSELNQGSAFYNEKMTELATLKASRDQLIKNLDEIMNDISKYEELKATIAHLQREVVEEKLKTKALTDELKKPINIHRWRRLMDTNTDTYGMIKRVRTLQKQIITKSSEVEKKDEAIQEKEKLYVDLRKVLARQPGSEAAEQLRLYAATLREKKAKYKQMGAELKMYQAKVYEYKYELQKLSQDMQLVKLEYFNQRRRHARGAQNQMIRTGGFSNQLGGVAEEYEPMEGPMEGPMMDNQGPMGPMQNDNVDNNNNNGPDNYDDGDNY